MNALRTRLAFLTALARVHWRALCVCGGVLLSYALAGFFLVPRVARAQLEDYVTGTLHRQLTLGELHFNPFTLQVEASDFRLSEADGSPLLGFKYLRVNASLASLWRRGAALQEIQLDAPDVQLVIESDGSVNLARLAPPAAPASEPASAPPRISIDQFTVTEGRIGLQDRTRARPFAAAIAPIKFSLTDFKTDVGHGNAYRFSGVTQSGEGLDWSGQFTVQPLGSTGTFSVTGLRAQTLDAYLEAALPFRLAAGALTLHGDYKFDLEPLAFELTLPAVNLRDFALAERSGTATPVVLPRLDIAGVRLSSANRTVQVQQATLGGARIDVAREADGSINLLRLLGSNTESTAAPAREVQLTTSTQQPAAAPWKFGLDSLQVTQATVNALDRTTEPVAQFAITPIDVTLDGLSSDLAAPIEVDAAATVNAAGQLKAAGSLQLQPLQAQLRVGVAKFELPSVQPYLDKFTAMTLHSGQLDIDGDLTYATHGTAPPSLAFKGSTQVADLRTTDDFLNQDFVKWRSLAVSGIDLRMNPDRLNIERIEARQPYATVIIARDRVLNVTRVLNPGMKIEAREATDEEPAPAAAQPASKPFPLRIKQVTLIDGSANFADYSIEPSFATGILGLNGTVTGLASDPAARAKVKLAGKVDKYAPVDITGEVNPLAAAKFADLAMNFRNMELTTFNPYSGKFAGYNISKGKLSTQLHYKVADRKLDAAHHIVIDNLEFGDKTDSKDAAPIPLKLGVALLKDRNGVIDVNLPVGGTLDDPKFKLGPLVWKAVLGLLTKMVTAPFAALGALFGGGEELALVDFPAGSAVLAPEQAAKLNTLSKALVERPQLRLSVPLMAVAAADSEAIAQAALSARLPAETAADEAARRKRVVLLEKTYQEIAKSAPAYPPELADAKTADLAARLQFLNAALLEKLRPTDAVLSTLAQQRARAVQDALLANAELNPERVFITAERVEGKPGNGTVAMEMKLE